MLKKDGEIQSKLQSKHRERCPRRTVDIRKIKLWEQDQSCDQEQRTPSEKSKLEKKDKNIL